MKKSNRKKELLKKYIPISCLCSVYINTTLNELSLSIKSLLIQNKIPKEIIIVIDGKIKKEVYNFLEFLDQNYKIFKFVKLQNNIGLGLALKEGLKYCEYNLIARFDSDDINLRDRLKIQYDHISENKDIDVLGTFVKEYNFINSFPNSRIKKVPRFDKDIKTLMNYRNPINHPSILFKKESILKAGSYESMIFFEDYYLWLKCKKSNCKFHNIEIPLLAMKRESNLLRRYGLKYAIFEVKFFYASIKNNLLSIPGILFLTIKLIMRILPKSFLEFIYLYDFKRTKFEKDKELSNYINTLKLYEL